ncbi:MAG: hypothetical protein JRE64_18255, partial [Deltaproteobacteria bacterium]|nr:hypothetical protein [Deltaproteobacteria bacterium]
MMSKILRNVFCCFTVCFLTCFILVHPAIADESANKEIPLNQYGIRSTNPYVADRFIEDGKSIDMVIVPSRPRPSEGFIRQVAMVPEPDIAAGTNTISNVPAMTWCFGCSATSAAMMFGHYDNSDYIDMYTGPTNGGVFPMTNEVWGTVVINEETRALCPLSATRLNLDGRTIMGHVDDYWINFGNPGPDPFIDSWTEHTHGECTGDYMGTNQSSFSNTDGSTTFYYYPDGSPLYDYIPGDSTKRDGCHGLRLFAESRGYTVDTNFSQYIYGHEGNTQGFTFDDFKAEIDAGRPVLIQVEGHTMLGYGYDDTGSIIYIHDTWDYSDHSMTWGGSYSGMTHYGVTVLQLAAIPTTATKDELAIDFKTLGIYVYNTGIWNRIYQGIDPDRLCSFGTNLAVDFGTTYGLYVYDAGVWTRVYKGVAIEKMAGLGDKLAVDFGTSYPMYEYNFATDTWSRIYKYSSQRDTIEALGDKLVVDFKAAGIYVYDAGSWNRI